MNKKNDHVITNFLKIKKNNFRRIEQKSNFSQGTEEKESYINIGKQL